MSKKREESTRPSEKTDQPVESTAKRRPPGMTAWRENVESAVTVLLVFFLLRTFQAEGFEIPTGSMGPTLMGRHKDLTCERCGYPYQVGSSEEIDQETGRRNHGADTSVGVCPVCRYMMKIGPRDPEPERSYRGDRIGVDKMRYRFADPERWEVAVFKCPERASENYIKRIVGLPGETLQIYGGDLFTRPVGDENSPWTIARKPPDVVRAMSQPVADSAYACAELVDAGWPTPWRGDTADWKVLDAGRRFEIAAGDTTAWLRFEHRPAGHRAWEKIDRGEKLSPDDVAPRQLVTDFCGFNTGSNLGEDNRRRVGARVVGTDTRSPDPRALGLHWVGDLTLDAEFVSESDGGEILLELVEGGRIFGCRFDLSTGEATLSDSGRAEFHPKSQTTVRGRGRHRVGLSNVDDRLTLWVDDKPVEFAEPTEFEWGPQPPTEADLSPAAVGVRQAKVAIERIALARDVYHIAATESRQYITDWDRNPALLPPSEETHQRFFSDPSLWGVFVDQRMDVMFDLQADQFFMMGDNSPNSWDTRFWTEPDFHFVHRDLLVGRAVCVYWPHGWSAPVSVRLPGTEIDVPFYPNFKRMRLIH